MEITPAEKRDTENKTSAALRTPMGAFVPLMIIVGLGLAVAAGLYSSRRMLLPVPANGTQAATATQGASLDVALEVMSAQPSGELETRILTKNDSGYLRTGDSMKLMLSRGTAIIMGDRSNIRAGSVLQAHGKMAAAGTKTLIADRIVVLTNYVSVH